MFVPLTQNLPDKVVKASRRVEAFPYDIEAWAVLIREAQVNVIFNEHEVIVFMNFRTRGLE